MNLEELKREFMFKYDAASNGGPDLNNYEISVCLTQAAKDIYNAAYQSYETSETSKRILAPFISSITDVPELITDPFTNFKTYEFTLPNDVNYRIRDLVILKGCIKNPEVKLIDKDHLSSALVNPYKQPNKRKVLREDLSLTKIKLYSELDVTNYKVEYLKKDNPIVVANLEDDPELNGDESLEGVNTESLTLIDGLFHDRIIDRAVVLAISITRENSLQTKSQV